MCLVMWNPGLKLCVTHMHMSSKPGQTFVTHFPPYSSVFQHTYRKVCKLLCVHVCPCHSESRADLKGNVTFSCIWQLTSQIDLKRHYYIQRLLHYNWCREICDITFIQLVCKRYQLTRLTQETCKRVLHEHLMAAYMIHILGIKSASSPADDPCRRQKGAALF